MMIFSNHKSLQALSRKLILPKGITKFVISSRKNSPRLKNFSLIQSTERKYTATKNMT